MNSSLVRMQLYDWSIFILNKKLSGPLEIVGRLSPSRSKAFNISQKNCPKDIRDGDNSPNFPRILPPWAIFYMYSRNY